MNTEELITKSKKLFKNKFDYSKSEYTKSKTTVEFRCLKHDFIFRQRASEHLNSVTGCKKCSSLNRKSFNNLKYYKDKIYEKNQNYRSGIFEIIEYINGKVTTKDCFGACAVKPDTLYKSGIPNIGNAIDKKSYAINQFNSIHKQRYDYTKFEYVKSITPSVIICRKHGEFKCNHHNHLQGKGCNKCHIDFIIENPIGWSNTNWQNSSKTSNFFDGFKVYIIKCWSKDEIFYKVGKTYNTVNRRFMGLCYEWEVVSEIRIKTAKEATTLEAKLKRQNKLNKYIPINSFAGMQECFTKIIR